VLSLLVANGVAQTLAFTEARAAATSAMRPQVLAAAQLLDDGEPLLGQFVSAPGNPGIPVALLAPERIRDALPDDPVRPIDLLNASATLQVASSPATFGLAPATGLTTHGLLGEVPPEGGCHVLRAVGTAYLDLPPTPEGSQVELTTADPELVAHLISGSLASRPTTLPSTPEIKTYIGTTARDATLRVHLTPGRIRLCLGEVD
jgi:hypothetical protein